MHYHSKIPFSKHFVRISKSWISAGIVPLVCIAMLGFYAHTHATAFHITTLLWLWDCPIPEGFALCAIICTCMYIDVVACGLYGTGFYWPSSIELRVTSHFCVFDWVNPPSLTSIHFWLSGCVKKKRKAYPQHYMQLVGCLSEPLSAVEAVVGDVLLPVCVGWVGRNL